MCRLTRLGKEIQTKLYLNLLFEQTKQVERMILESARRGGEGMAEGGWGGNSAMPERNQNEASPATLLVESRTQQKSFLFLLEEKVGRAQIRKSEEKFFAGWRVVASGGGVASLVPLEKSSRKVYNYSTSSNLFGIKNRERFCGSQNRALIFAKTLSACGGSREIP